MTTITCNNSEETTAAFERCRRNGWRVTAIAVGKSASAWVLTVDTGAEAEAQPELPINSTLRAEHTQVPVGGVLGFKESFSGLQRLVTKTPPNTFMRTRAN